MTNLATPFHREIVRAYLGSGYQSQACCAVHVVGRKLLGLLMRLRLLLRRLRFGVVGFRRSMLVVPVDVSAVAVASVLAFVESPVLLLSSPVAFVGELAAVVEAAVEVAPCLLLKFRSIFVKPSSAAWLSMYSSFTSSTRCPWPTR